MKRRRKGIIQAAAKEKVFFKEFYWTRYHETGQIVLEPGMIRLAWLYLHDRYE